MKWIILKLTGTSEKNLKYMITKFFGCEKPVSFVTGMIEVQLKKNTVNQNLHNFIMTKLKLQEIFWQQWCKYSIPHLTKIWIMSKKDCFATTKFKFYEEKWPIFL